MLAGRVLIQIDIGEERFRDRAVNDFRPEDFTELYRKISSR